MTDYHLARLAEDAFDRFDDRESLWFEGRWYRRSALREMTHRVGGGLRARLGIDPGDRVVLFMPNLPEVGVLYTAIWRAGAVATPVIFLLPPEQLRHILVDADAAAIVTSPEFLSTVRTATDGLDVPVVVVGDSEDGEIEFRELAAAEPGTIVDRDGDDLSALLYTGGTTGRSKGVKLTHASLWQCAQATQARSEVEGVTRTVLALPLAHSYGMTVTVAGMHVREPGTSALLRWFEPNAFLDVVEQLDMQRATLVPSMIRMLLDQPLEARDLSSWQIANSGSAPLPIRWAKELETRAPNVTVLEGYGCTESSAVLTTNPPDRRKLGTVGPALPGHEVAVVNDEGARLPAGAAGEVVARGPGIMAGYWQDPDTTTQTLRDGWLYTGDVGSLDEDGYLTILDRKKDLIIRGGFNVYPADVEEALATHPDVAVAAVVGRPDDHYGEEVVAFVQLAPDATITADELVGWSREHIGGYKYPREIHVVEAVPLTPVLKIDRKAVRRLLDDG